ncbi:MAG: hypothetical protein IJ217_01500 [Clostridia bacterium]|nr:hypothetical protein [Clostridia bacterium]
MYKKFKDYNFREIAGHFILMRNTNIVKNTENFIDIDEHIEKCKRDIIEDTKSYYLEMGEYDEEFDYENTFNLDALNEDMTTRKVTDLYEPMYGYICIEKNRGFILYLLGNEEDKLKYVYAPTYWSCENESIDDYEIEIIDDGEYEHAIEFKELIQDDEELDDYVIETRGLKRLDSFRLRYSPDFVNCIISYKNTSFSAKVKLEKIYHNTIYAKYHEQEGVVKLVEDNNISFLFFKPIEQPDDEVALNEYVSAIMELLDKDFGVEEDNCIEFVKDYQKDIETGYINGDLPLETIVRILRECEF